MAPSPPSPPENKGAGRPPPLFRRAASAARAATSRSRHATEVVNFSADEERSHAEVSCAASRPTAFVPPPRRPSALHSGSVAVDAPSTPASLRSTGRSSSATFTPRRLSAAATAAASTPGRLLSALRRASTAVHSKGSRTRSPRVSQKAAAGATATEGVTETGEVEVVEAADEEERLLRSLLAAVYQRPLYDDEACVVLNFCPEIGWLAQCLQRSPLPAGWWRHGSFYEYSSTGQRSETSPLLGRYAELANLLVRARSDPREAPVAADTIRRVAEETNAEAAVLRNGWTGPFVADATAGAEAQGKCYYYNAVSGVSSWEDPAGVPAFLGSVAQQLLQLEVLSAPPEQPEIADSLTPRSSPPRKADSRRRPASVSSVQTRPSGSSKRGSSCSRSHHDFGGRREIRPDKQHQEPQKQPQKQHQQEQSSCSMPRADGYKEAGGGAASAELAVALADSAVKLAAAAEALAERKRSRQATGSKSVPGGGGVAGRGTSPEFGTSPVSAASPSSTSVPSTSAYTTSPQELRSTLEEPGDGGGIASNPVELSPAPIDTSVALTTPAAAVDARGPSRSRPKVRNLLLAEDDWLDMPNGDELERTRAAATAAARGNGDGLRRTPALSSPTATRPQPVVAHAQAVPSLRTNHAPLPPAPVTPRSELDRILSPRRRQVEGTAAIFESLPDGKGNFVQTPRSPMGDLSARCGGS